MSETIRVAVQHVNALLQRIPGTFGNVVEPVGFIVASGDLGDGRRAAIWYVFQRGDGPLADSAYDEGESGVNVLVPLHESAMGAMYEIARTPGARITVSRAVTLCGLEAVNALLPGSAPPPTMEELLARCPWRVGA